jgi:L-rhamnose isomerase
VDYQGDYERLATRSVDMDYARSRLKEQHIETLSGAYADSGTRFHVYHWPASVPTPMSIASPKNAVKPDSFDNKE